MPENNEKCSSQIPKAQGDVFKSPKPKEIQFTFTFLSTDATA